ncbi:HAD-IA family hydrolase [Candidatus Saccharibacteria bacterium]|nr:HAD-IA family hydrolase [Candidatus Saccharibacteria bacterium]
MIKAIIFDCFGVLTTDGWLPFKNKYFGSDQLALDEITALNNKANVGDLSYGDFTSLVASKANISQQSAREQIDKNVPNDELFDYIKLLKKNYKIGLLSNIGADWLVKLFTSEQIALFDETSLSYDSGYTKPDSRAYKDITNKLRVNPAEAVFVDDQEQNCKAAEAMSIQSICYKNFEQMKSELEQILAAVSNN